MEDLVQEYNKRNGVIYEFRAINDDDEVIVKKTSEISFDDLVGYSELLDEYIYKEALNEQEHKQDLIDESFED